MSARLSRRLDWELGENRLSQALAARGAELFDLTLCDPTRAGLVYPEAELRALLGGPALLVHQPEPLGLLGAREAVCRYLHESRGVTVEPGRVLLTASTSEACGLLFKLLCDPGDAVLVPEPSYPLFDLLAQLEGVRPERLPLRWDGEWHLDTGALAERLASGPRIRAVLVVNPGNPTGAFLKRDEQERLVSLCAAHGCALIGDEVFFDFAAGRDPRRAPSCTTIDGVLTFTLSGLSKVCGLPQLKLAFCAVSGPPDEVARAVARLELIADTYLSVAGPVQQALGGLLRLRHGLQQQLRERCARGRSLLAAARGRGAPWDLLPAEGGWSALVRTGSARSDEELALALLDAGVLVQPGYLFDLPPGHLVVGLLTPEAVLAEGARRLAARLGALAAAPP